MSQAFLYSVEREFPVPVRTLWSAWTEAEQAQAGMESYLDSLSNFLLK